MEFLFSKSQGWKLQPSSMCIFRNPSKGNLEELVLGRADWEKIEKMEADHPISISLPPCSLDISYFSQQVVVQSRCENIE